MTAQAVADLGVRSTVVAGGPASVSDAVLSSFPAPRRIGGATRFDVSAGVAAWAAANGVDSSSVLVANGGGTVLADALSGGQLGRITVYANGNTLPAPVASWLDGNARLALVTVLGGEASVGPLAAGRAQQAVLG
ncbi:MAG: cell wall-binding repeat-containing protein [Micrococcales bacterium]|nr:cell wall-binding repeat-containing protein [Micrococcales bacterium]